MGNEQTLQDEDIQKDAMTFEKLGAKLYALRQTRSLELKDVARHIKLSKRTLLSIEEGRQEDLPHTVYAKGFIRTYARFLGMPEDEIAESLNIVFPSEEEEQIALSGIIKPPKKSGPIGTIVLLLLLAVLAVGGWSVYSNIINPSDGQPSAPSHSNNQPVQLSPQAEVPAEIVPSETEEVEILDTTESSQVANLEIVTPKSTDFEVEETNLVQNSNATAAAYNSNTDVDGPIYFESGRGLTALAGVQEPSASVATKKYRVVITAIEECWIRATTDGRNEQQFNLPKNQSSVFTFDTSLRIRLGNVAGVNIRYNGVDFTIPSGGNTRDLVFPPVTR